MLVNQLLVCHSLFSFFLRRSFFQLLTTRETTTALLLLLETCKRATPRIRGCITNITPQTRHLKTRQSFDLISTLRIRRGQDITTTMGLFHRNGKADGADAKRKNESNDIELASSPSSPNDVQVNHNGHKVTKGIAPEGESGRRGIHPIHFLKICFRSASRMSCIVNILWPVVGKSFCTGMKDTDVLYRSLLPLL